MDRTVKILVILFAVLGIALFGYHWIKQWHTNTLDQAVGQEKENCLQRIAELEANINKLMEEARSQNPEVLTKTEMADVFGAAKPESMDCGKISAQVAAFFHYLDSKSNLLWPEMDIEAEQLYDQVYKKLVANPPINVGEMENLISLTRNVAHFYRILGKDQIHLIKKILTSESAVVEPAMAVMHAWLALCSETGQPISDEKQLAQLYPYAAFFLNTLGGRSYLLRRDSKVRMLVNYYSVLTVDMANDHQLNSYGLDIRPYLDYLFYDMNNQKGLMYRERYLTQLATLKDKYPQLSDVEDE